MSKFRQNRHAGSPWASVLGWLCIALIVFAGTVSVTHTHQHALGDHESCSLCLTAHAVAQAATTPVAVTTVTVYISIDAVLLVGRTRTFQGSADPIRPPPVVLDRA